MANLKQVKEGGEIVYLVMKAEPAGKHFNSRTRRVNKKKLFVVFMLFLLLVFAFFTLLIPKNKA